MPRIVVVRHGNTFAPGEPVLRIGARTDPPLVESGRAQAAALRERFAALGWRFDRVLAGPLRRTRESAALIVGVEPGIADWLAEIDHGPDEGRPEEDVAARVGRAALDRWDREAIAPVGWIVDAEARVPAWHAAFATADDLLLVTSNGAARFALLALGEQPEGGLKLRTGAYGVIETAPPRLVEWDVRPES
ncbi:MAG TPA: histidine phosphatase family protein [Sphingomonas sp.]|jgi:probable phosphoglycerate mutase